MVLHLLAALALGHQTPEIQILMLGNSHTGVNGLPNTLASLLNSDGGPRVRISTQSGMFLDDIATPAMLQNLRAGKWDVVILQAAKMSSSHKYSYPQDGPIALAKAAIAGKTKVFWFPEWPRKGWQETDFILGIYGADARAGGGTLIPIPRIWDLMLAKSPAADLWFSDGNHASPAGSLLVADTMYYWLRGSDVRTPTFQLPNIPRETVTTLLQTAHAGWKKYRRP